LGVVGGVNAVDVAVKASPETAPVPLKTTV
jgi:hypothetical protein